VNLGVCCMHMYTGAVMQQYCTHSTLSVDWEKQESTQAARRLRNYGKGAMVVRAKQNCSYLTTYVKNCDYGVQSKYKVFNKAWGQHAFNTVYVQVLGERCCT